MANRDVTRHSYFRKNGRGNVCSKTSAFTTYRALGIQYYYNQQHEVVSVPDLNSYATTLGSWIVQTWKKKRRTRLKGSVPVDESSTSTTPGEAIKLALEGAQVPLLIVPSG